MKSNMQWLVKNRVLYWKLSGKVTMDEFRKGLVEINTFLQLNNERLHVIVNARTARSLEGDNTVVRQIVSYTARNPQMGCMFVITSSFVMKHHLNRVTADFGTQLRYTDTFRHAWSSLHNIDRALPYVAPQKPDFAKATRRYA